MQILNPKHTPSTIYPTNYRQHPYVPCVNAIHCALTPSPSRRSLSEIAEPYATRACHRNNPRPRHTRTWCLPRETTRNTRHTCHNLCTLSRLRGPGNVRVGGGEAQNGGEPPVPSAADPCPKAVFYSRFCTAHPHILHHTSITSTAVRHRLQITYVRACMFHLIYYLIAHHPSASHYTRLAKTTWRLSSQAFHIPSKQPMHAQIRAIHRCPCRKKEGKQSNEHGHP